MRYGKSQEPQKKLKGKKRRPGDYTVRENIRCIIVIKLNVWRTKRGRKEANEAKKRKTKLSVPKRMA